MHATTDVRSEVTIQTDRGITVGAFAKACLDKGLGRRSFERLIEAIDTQVVRKRCGKKYARELDQHWFLLYDGDDNPQRKAALVSEERPEAAQATFSGPVVERNEPTGIYHSSFITDPETVYELFALARDNYTDLLEASADKGSTDR